jgi:hypothetical protein
MIPPHEVVLQLYHAFDILWVVLLQEEEQLCFDSSLVVVLLLVFNKLDSDLSVGLVVDAFNNLPKSAFTNDLYILESISNLISINYSVIPFLIVKPVIY